MSSPDPTRSDHPVLNAAILRFVAAVIAIGIALSMIVYVPDPAVKVLGGTLLASAVLAVEQIIKVKAGL